MGLFGALFAGVSGLDSQSNKISMISNNISNVNTIGYKEVQSSFDSLVVPSGGSSFAPGGVISGTQQLVSKQGLVQGTSSGTDIAISGNGFFAINTQPSGITGQLLYTRSGSFTQDASGNFINSNGYYLQGWALDANGNLPANSTSPSSLTTVSIKSSSSGVATPTSTISLTANLNAAQETLLGSGEALNFDATSPNYSNTAQDIIVPNNGLVRGDTLDIVNNGVTASKDILTYGGFAIGRSVTDPTSTGLGDSAGTTALNSFTNQSNVFTTDSNTGTTHTITVTLPSATGYSTGDTINISGVSATLDNIPATLINANHTITKTGANTFTFTVTTPSSVTTNGVTGGGTTTDLANGSSLIQSFLNQASPFTADATTDTTHTITVAAPNNGYSVGQTVNIQNAAALDGISASLLNGNQTITSVSQNSFTFSVTNGSNITTTGATGGGTSVDFANRTYPFAGNILDATTTAGTFLGTTTTSPFTPNALTFQVATTNEGSLTFKYVTTTPNAANGEFNSLDTLATAINDTTNLNARIVNGKIYIGANDANEAVTFTNGDATGSGSFSGINWVSELGLSNVAAATTGEKRFSDLSNLSTQINLDSQVTSTVTNPLGASTLNINESNPTQTIQFTDGASNTGSILRELGFTDSNGNDFSPTATVPLDTGTFAVKYDSADPNKNMSSGKITPQFSNTTTVYDALGNSHSVAVNTVKINNNTWAVEVTSVPASDITSATRTDGQLAAGIVTFSGNGTLASITPSLANPVNIAWSNGASTSSISLNLGTIGSTGGLSQFNLASNGTSTQNGSSAGNLTGVSIDASGDVISTFSNGQTQKVFKIPLIQINNPDGLASVSGDAFSQTQSSGIATAVSAGTDGTGTITPSALEGSTVDLSTQLTDLIVAQQAYGANSKLLTVADQLLQQLDQIIQ